MQLIDIVNLFSLPGDLEFASSKSFASDSNRRAYLEYRCAHFVTCLFMAGVVSRISHVAHLPAALPLRSTVARASSACALPGLRVNGQGHACVIQVR